jgi:hypothetical protein
MSIDLKSIYHPYDRLLNEAKLLLRKYIDDCDSISDQLTRVEIEVGRLIESEKLDFNKLFEAAKTSKMKLVPHLLTVNEAMSSTSKSRIDSINTESEDFGYEQLHSKTKHYNLSFLLEEPYPKLYHFVANTKSRALLYSEKVQLMENKELISVLSDFLGVILAYREYVHS